MITRAHLDELICAAGVVCLYSLQAREAEEAPISHYETSPRLMDALRAALEPFRVLQETPEPEPEWEMLTDGMLQDLLS